MPRIGRVVAQNKPHHIVQRGHNKNAVFVKNEGVTGPVKS
jgi:putative transposase